VSRFARIGLVVLVLAVIAAVLTRPTSTPNIVVIVVDTLRADRLGVYGHDRPTSPHSDALAARGMVFDRAYAASSWTLPSVASYLTGLQPPEHGVLDWTGRLADDAPYLPAALQDAGYTTVGIVGNANVNADSGFARGFDLFLEARTEPKAAKTGLPLYPSAQDLTDLALDALDRIRDGRFFLYVHYMDPHAPYLLPPGAEDRFADPDYDGFLVTELDDVRPVMGPRYMRAYPYFWSKFQDTDADRERIRALYDSKVAYADAQIGRLLDRIDALDGDTLVVFTSDHGEGLFEHGIREHEDEPYEHQLRVPLIFAGPGVEPGRIDAPAELVDLPLALAAFANADDRFANTHGNGVLPAALAGEPAPESPSVLSHVRIADRDLVAWAIQRGDRKLILAGERSQVFDLARDPGEKTDLSGQDPEADRALGALLQGRIQELTLAASTGTGPVDEALLEQLRALGYID
jgi:arylsulfatase A-like enzyme